jgi:hypothetical protein
VYAYGISQMFRLADLLTQRIRAVPRAATSAAAAIFIAAVLVAPVYYPHRFYERHYAKAAAGRKDFSSYYAELKGRVPEEGFYYAGSLAQINFPLNLNCVGMQHFFDEKEIRRAQKAFSPRLMALTPEEFGKPYFAGLMNALRQEGYVLKPRGTKDCFAVLVEIYRPE